MESKKIKILAIDDNKDNLISLKALIKEAFPDVTILIALSGEKGLELAAAEDPDVILLDIVMPGMDGFDVCGKLKADKKLSDIPLVFVTALKGDKESRIRALECGAEAFLSKPIDESELTAQIRAMMKIKTAANEKHYENERLEALVEEQTHELKVTHRETLNLLDELRRENDARKKSEEALKDANVKLTRAQRIAHVGSWNNYLLTNQLNWSEEMYRILGFPLNTPVNLEEIIHVFPPEELERFRKAVGAAINADVPYNIDYKIIRPDGAVRYIHDEGEIVRDEQGKAIWMHGITHDITERKQSEEEIKNIKESLEKLNQHLDEIRENERAIISREIHDQLGQSLTALKIDLNWLRGQMAGDSEKRAKVEGMIELVTTTIRDVQRISFELRPAILDDLGLAAAVEWYCEEFANRTGLKVNMEMDDVQTESISKNLAIYRVLQESLTNIIRHAGAKKVQIKLRKIKKDIILIIHDDGIGISPDKIRSSKSLGLMGMFERVKQSGGKMEITTPVKGGTNVRIYIPIK